ncbi:MAG TPA: tRNA (N(6)-L-threonylcarbamoyladenosine(37)-C(2))-methylthiotransferase MtaB [Spirochaetales bacterium]|nr:tRNA (N(6)-L-threonylcarbamoyladenosine(37)-C(2))-methylthiotransferase MtaB [Spirochaetales bacterium]
MIQVAFHTLGCKLNQLETESIADAFLKVQATILEDPELSNLYIVNTCTVTGKAEQKARHAIRQALSQNPETTVIVTGCYAQMAKAELEAISPRTVVVPGEKKSALLGLPEWLHDNWQEHGDLLDAVLQWRDSVLSTAEGAGGIDPFAFNPDNFVTHSRPSLKIEDGCNNRCTYCRVCLARGPARSLSATELLRRVQLLEAHGKHEVVLTGVNLAQYLDRNDSNNAILPQDRTKFPDLLSFLIGNTNSIRFRISSYEPDCIDDAFLATFSNPRVQPHIHLSVQSGSDTVLERMARRYTAQEVRNVVASLRQAKRDPFIAADIITGFPGETEEEFALTEALCTELDLAWIHAFPFSPRPGTKAFDMRPQIPQRVAGERVERLTAIAVEGKKRYAERWLGSVVDAILERESDEHNADEQLVDDGLPEESSANRHIPTDASQARLRFGTTANYLKAAILDVPPYLKDGELVRTRLIAPGTGHKSEVLARYVPNEASLGEVLLGEVSF